MKMIAGFKVVSKAVLVFGITATANSQVVVPASNDAYANDTALRFNYAEALQKSLYFLEAQQNGGLSPNNRVAWRGAANLTDGRDIGRDLSGGLFDAGDHWTANNTMAFLATTLAWSAVEKPGGWTATGQMDELLETLIHVNRYFVKCVLNPDVADPAHNLEVAIGCGGREGVPDPKVHAIWAGGEMADVLDPSTGLPFTNRPTFRLTPAAPGGDVPAAMASAMAAASMVIRSHGQLLAGKPGYADFDANAFAGQLLDLAGKLALFANENKGPSITDALTQPEKDAISLRRETCLRADGQQVVTGYRSDPIAQTFTALTWLARATEGAAARAAWVALAEQVYEGPYKAEYNDDWWKDYGWNNPGKLGAYNMMRLFPADTRFHGELQYYTVRFLGYTPTPGGLRFRETNAHEYGSLRHANNAAAIALFYSDHIDTAPPLPGNEWWKGGLSDGELKALLFRVAKRQVDYALGANPYGRSYLVGFGSQPFNHSHHRGAYGPWNGYEHFIEGNGSRRGTARHLLYGALIAGPDNRDVFLCGDDKLVYQQVPGTGDYDFFYRFPNPNGTLVRKSTYTFDPANPPVQDVFDSKFNEVALDYNAGFTASLAWLNAGGFSNGGVIPDAEFPPVEARDESLDLWNTDREFLVTGNVTGESTAGIRLEGKLWNRSRWPARPASKLSFRYYFTHDGAITATLENAPGATVGAVETDAAGRRYVLVSWPDTTLSPVTSGSNARTFTLTLSGANWNSADDWSYQNAAPGSQRVFPGIPVYGDSILIGGAPEGDTPEAPDFVKLVGTPIGTPGSWQGEGNTFDRALDGSLLTFFDAPSDAPCWTGIDLGVGNERRITQVCYAPRNGEFAYRLSGSIIQVSNSADFSAGTVDLFTIDGPPTAGELTSRLVATSGAYRYLRILMPSGSYGNISEIQFFTTPTALEVFRSYHGLAMDGSEDGLIPAGDGVENLLKFAFNMIGTGPGQAPDLNRPNHHVLAESGNAGLPCLGIDPDGKLTVTYVRRKLAIDSGVSSDVEFSAGLTADSWLGNPAASVQVSSIDSVWERVKVTDSESSMKRFARVRVSAP